MGQRRHAAHLEAAFAAEGHLVRLLLLDCLFRLQERHLVPRTVAPSIRVWIGAADMQCAVQSSVCIRGDLYVSLSIDGMLHVRHCEWCTSSAAKSTRNSHSKAGAYLVPLLPEVERVAGALLVQFEEVGGVGLPGGQVQKKTAHCQWARKAEGTLVLVHLRQRYDSGWIREFSPCFVAFVNLFRVHFCCLQAKI